MKLLGNRLLLQQVKSEEKIGSIVLPQNLEEKSVAIGEVKEIGSLVELDLQPGQKVMFNRYNAIAWGSDDSMVFVDEDDVLCCIED